MNNNFNAGQFINSFLQFQARRLIQTPTTNNAANLAQQAAAPLAKQIITPQAQVLQNMLEIPKMQLEMLNSIDKGALVKELMNMPKEFSQLVSMFTLQTNSGQPLLDISKLITFLQQNGTQGKQNLLNLIVTVNKAGFTQAEQLKELNYIINACIPSNQSSTAAIMKNLILLYLPWLPLGDGAGFDIEVKEKKEQEGGEDDDSVMIYIRTVNFGTLKILLKVEGKAKILLSINCDEKFPKTTAEKRFKEETQTYSIQSKIEYSLTQQQGDGEDELTGKEENSSQTKVTVNTSRHINPLLMMASQSVIRIVFEIDKNAVEVGETEDAPEG